MSIECGLPTVSVWQLLKGAYNLLKDPVVYAMSSKSFADSLKEEVRKLRDEAERVGVLEIEARNNLRNFHSVFTTWKASAEEALKEARDLLETFDEATKTCCYGTLPDPCCRYQFSTKAEAQIKVVRELAQQCIDRFKELNNISCIPPPGEVQLPTATASVFSASTSIKPREDGLFESRALMIQNIIDALANNSNSVVGIHGMGGVGKSTLLVDIEKRIREENSFDWVVRVDVSENPDIKRIQGEIARALELTDMKNEEYLTPRAELLRKRLEKEEREKKKVLIILDNLWDQLDLKSVGIPCGPDNKARGCKLLLTSRDQHVLLREMRCESDSAFLLGGLENEEAKRLFEKMVGGKVHEEEFKPLVEEALRICAGLPFLILQIAKLFIHTSYSDCDDALKHIWSEETGKVITNTLQLSYGRISDEAKSLLRLCVAYGASEPPLEYLARYGFGLGIFQKVSSMQEARDKLPRLIHTLQATSLLLDRDEDADGFKIHDLVREFVASTDRPLLVLKDKNKWETELSEDKLKSCEAICFPYLDLEELPKELVCPELHIFLLFENNKSLEVSDSYFNSMKNLMALALIGIRLTHSPSLSHPLENLHSLCLEYCSVEDVAILGELKGLQILSLRYSDIQRLPKEIGQLTELRLLDLDYCSELYTIEPGVFGRLTKLEELYMHNSFDQWDVVELTPPTNAHLIELNNMKKLRILYVSIRNSSALPKDLDVEKLTKYRIQVGNVWERNEYEGSMTLELNLGPTSDVQSICELSQDGFPKLQHLQVEDSPSIYYILQRPSFIAFKALETLFLENMINLEKITNNNVSSESFSSLRVVRVESCNKMEVLFPHSVARELRQLEEIKVESCKLMRGIVEADGDCGKFELPKLRELKLHDLPNIENFFTTGSSPSTSTTNDQVGTQIAFFNRQQVAFPTLEKLEIDGLDNLKCIFFPSMVKSLTQLRKLSVSYCKNMEAIIMEEEGSGVEISEILAFPMLTNLRLVELKSLTCFSRKKCSQEGRSQDHVQLHSNALFNQEVAFPTLEKLEIDCLDNLRCIFFPSMVKSLTQLRKLSVSYCKNMEAIIMEEEGSRVEISEILAFPMLTNLRLVELKSLTCFSRKKCSQEGRSQDHVQLHSNALFNQEVSFPFLESLTIEGLPNLKEIWSDESPLELSNLRSLEVMRCESLLKVISFRSLVQLHMLQSLCINDCSSVQEIFYYEGSSASGIVETLSELTTLELNKLVSLRCIWNKSPSGIMRFHNLKEFELDHFDNLEFIFFPSMVKSLPQLRDLMVSNCKKMETIIAEEEGLGMEISETLAFPMLTNLTLTYLKSLTSFSCGKCSREARSEDRVNSNSATLFSREVAFPSLEILCIKGIDNIEMIWDDQVAMDSFSKLNLLYVDKCNKLVNVVPSIVLGQLLSLERLVAQSCGSLKVVFKFQPLNPLDGHSVARSSLKELVLFDLPELKCVWDKELHHQVKFQCLHSVHVSQCLSLTSLFPASVARDLSELQKFKIDTCGIVELIEKEGLEEMSINVEAIGGTSHELKVILSFTSRFQHLKTLDVSYCDRLSNMFTPTMATNLVGLTKLRISKCGLLTEVISDEGGREGHVVAFNQLKYIELDGLIGLRCFYSGGYTLMLPLLEEVIVTGCPKMKFFSEGPIEASKLERVQISEEAWFWKGKLNITIQNMFEEMGRIGGIKNMLLSEFSELIGKWHSELNPIKSSWQLESLTVDKCPSFINAIPSRLMLALEHMNTLQVRDCESLEEIFDLEGLEAVENTRVLRSFMTLDLVNLPKLRRLWNKDLQGTMRLNSLSSLTLYKCSKLRHAFIPSMAQCLANLRWMAIKECGQMEGVIAEEEGQGSAMEKTTFPELKWLTLECLPNLTSFLLGKNHTLECPKLAELIVTHCPKMRSLAWQSLIEINNGTPSLFTPQVQFPQLESIVLTHMDNLSKIWTNNPLETLTFEYLRKLKAQNCRSLENLFPQWVATSLNQLKKVQVESCGIEEIVANGDDTLHSTTAQVLFPKLTSLVLHDMPRLKSFCPNLPTLNWPFLEELRVTHCDKLNTLSFAASMSKWTQRDNQQDLSSQEVQTTFERDFPNLERLSLLDKDIQMIRDGKFPNYIFGKPKALTLACCHDENAVFPPRFLLERFRNMESLEVFCGSFEDIFPYEGIVDEGKHPVLESLTELKLSKLHKLKRLWREDYLVSKILQSIVTLEVWDCPGLTTLFPVVTSFKNLAILVVKNSSGLVHLGTISTVTNLVHLIEMTIIGCERMKEVVANDGNGEEKVISLANLERLTLQNMPSLEGFTSTTSCILRFPSLYYIKVEECPKMKIFSKNILSTPMLSDGTLFRYSYKDAQWKGDLNKAIQELSA